MNIEELKSYYPVVIAGGGPVGLYLGCCLHQRDIPFVILEKRRERIKHSRSLGVHPVSLELFDDLSIANRFVKKGIKIKQGHAFSDKGKIGSISFESCPDPFNFILSLPQHITEEILEEHLQSLNPNALIRGAEVEQIDEQDDQVVIEIAKENQNHILECACLVGCDGKESLVREQADISFEGSSYPDTYIMGDFDDNTRFGSDAAIFLSKNGLIESFPLENKRR
ncbi:MAG: FAD-dependent monooxygenase, partial [Candidatus Halalkalibacterium sp. M3_1C_030]